ncbi:prepilin-type N-terminal cleavage/methylation domain-containing protein [Methylosinus sp. PW1]|uniref:prepilin-type N-terminal cleavage/methylation domain-containing protein n=1 Tax=Methylosinus sp. PW1 TaxID=107636 RepID=UPI00055C4893|nr:prepilin-type N-terminal cleavage/methylation domain-containing protein [Methylosinus sp. PW1]
MRHDRASRRAGFTLIEALAALAVLAAFAAALGPQLFHARGALAKGKGRVAADALLRSLIAAPFDRTGSLDAREGETGGFRWRVTVEPISLEAPVFEEASAAKDKDGADARKWSAYRVEARVAWGDQSVAAETIRLALVH